jgi:hypothetical protein
VQGRADAKCKEWKMHEKERAYARGKSGRMLEAWQDGCAKLGRSDARGKSGRTRESRPTNARVSSLRLSELRRGG